MKLRDVAHSTVTMRDMRPAEPPKRGTTNGERIGDHSDAIRDFADWAATFYDLTLRLRDLVWKLQARGAILSATDAQLLELVRQMVDVAVEADDDVFSARGHRRERSGERDETSRKATRNE